MFPVANRLLKTKEPAQTEVHFLEDWKLLFGDFIPTFLSQSRWVETF